MESSQLTFCTVEPQLGDPGEIVDDAFTGGLPVTEAARRVNHLVADSGLFAEARYSLLQAGRRPSPEEVDDYIKNVGLPARITAYGASNASVPCASKAAPPQALGRFTPIAASALEALASNRVELVEGLLYRGDLAALVGEPGIGKSAVILSLAACITLGAPWLGRRTQKGRVLYMTAEGQAGILSRIRAFCKHHNLPDASYLIDVIPNRLSLTSQNDVDDLIRDVTEYLAGENYDFVGIDTLNNFFGNAEENSAKDMGQFALACRRFRAATGHPHLMVNHHITKSGDGRMRGSSALPGAIDVGFMLKKDRGDFISLHGGKPSRYEGVTPAQPIPLHRASVELGRGASAGGPQSAVAIELGTTSQGARHTPTEQRRSRAPSAPAQDEAGYRIVQTLQSAGMPISYSDLLAAVAACGISRSAFMRARTRMLNDGTLMQDEQDRYMLSPSESS